MPCGFTLDSSLCFPPKTSQSLSQEGKCCCSWLCPLGLWTFKMVKATTSPTKNDEYPPHVSSLGFPSDLDPSHQAKGLKSNFHHVFHGGRMQLWVWIRQELFNVWPAHPFLTFLGICTSVQTRSGAGVSLLESIPPRAEQLLNTACLVRMHSSKMSWKNNFLPAKQQHQIRN